MSLVPRQIFASRFSYDARTRIFVGEASDLGSGLAGRISDSSSDLGFLMFSERTKKTILCLWSGDSRDGERKLWDRYLCFAVDGRPLRGKLAGAECRVMS